MKLQYISAIKVAHSVGPQRRRSTSDSLTSSAEVTFDWLTLVESWFCFVWTGLCLAGGFNPLYPSGAVRQRNLCKPFLGLKPVVIFFSSAGAPFWSHEMA